MLSPAKFKKDTFSALNNPQLCGNFKGTMWGLKQKPQAIFPNDQDSNQLREIGHSTLKAMNSGELSTQMPTNTLLISGPSKTADIEQTLAYGIH